MISIKGLEYIKAIAELEADKIPGGVIYLISEGDTFTWRKASKEFDLDIFQVGEKLNENSVAGRALREKRTIEEIIPRSLYGTRLDTIAEPLADDEGNVVGIFSVVYPKVHPVIKAFKDFAPIISEMFPEGVSFYVTDLDKVVDKHDSKKFGVSEVVVGHTLGKNVLARRVMESNKTITFLEEDSSVYGVPVLISNNPLVDEETNEVVGSFGMYIPKEIAVNLRSMSDNLQSGLSGISASIEELAASASEIHTNEQVLNGDINGIISLSEEINQVTTFIKEIADETKMLGLNAAIEAARAGEAGRGFGVVAEEIRKLSDESKSTVPKINKLTDSIKSKVEAASEKSRGSLGSSQEQAAATQEITASIEEITSMSEELNKIAKQL